MSRVRSESLIGDYGFRVMNPAEFAPLFKRYRPIVFSKKVAFEAPQVMSAEERKATKKLGSNLTQTYWLRIGIYHREEFVGWSFGWQESAEVFYMCNTGILAAHQNKGIYTALLPKFLEILRRKGFQIVSSRHNATNNQVLVPKLKAGFLITGLEMSDSFGVMVRLSYYFNGARRHAMDFRAGQAVPDERIKPHLNLS